MKKIIRRTLAIALSLSMVFSGFMFSASKVSAAGLTEDEKSSIAGNGPMQNMVLGSVASLHVRANEGNAGNLTNGNITSGACALSGVSAGWGNHEEVWFVLDLGDYYKAESLDELILVYKDTATNDTVLNRTYNVQYSIDNDNFDTVYTSGTITEFNDDKATVLDLSTITGKVRYIKVDYPTSATYGIQLLEAAVLATNPQKAEMEQCDDPDSVTATSTEPTKITFNITPKEGQEGYRYTAYLDSSSGTLLAENCYGNTDYTVKVPGGNHTVFVQSFYQGAISPGISSNQVTVDTYEGRITDTSFNYAYGKNYTLSSGSSTEGNGSITNGIIASNDYATSDKGKAGSWFSIDLGDTYYAYSFEKLGVWFRVLGDGNAYPSTTGIKWQYSTDNETWTDSSIVTQTEFDNQKTGTAPFGIIGDVTNTAGYVRYVRLYIPQSCGWGAQVTEVGVFDIDGDATKAEQEVVTDPLDFTAESDDYNEITGTITADVGQEEYTYNVYMDNEPVLEGLTAGSYRIDGVESGTHTIVCKSVHNGFYSDGVSAGQVSVSDGFTYSSTTGTGVYDDTNENGTNLITQNGATVSGVTATASNGNANNAIDYNGGTRWEASSSDPQWLCVDLGAVKTIKEVDAWWETASAKDFKVQVSDDGTNFKTVGIVNGAASGANRRDAIVFADTVSGRYVRIYDTARTTQWGHSIYEMAVYDGQTVPDNYMDVTDYKAQGTYPTETGKIFAGWFEDAEFTTEYTGTTGYAYAKFIDDDVLTTKFQIATDDTAVRFISSVDSMDFEEVGFIFTGTYGNAVITEKTKTTEKLYTKITAAGESIEPDVFSPDSHYFFTYTIRGMENAKTNSTWHVTPFYKTLDGTVVTGTPGELPQN